MSQFILGNLLLLASVTAASFSQILIKEVLNRGTWTPLGFALIHELMKPDILYRALLAGGLMVGGYLFWLASLTKLNLSYAYPIACSSVLPVAFLSAWLLGEKLSLQNWVGTALILFGIILLMPARE